MRHLQRVSQRHCDTGMTAKNLAIVWAPNLLRCQELEAGGVEALSGVAVQAVVTEYLIKYCHLIFSVDPTDDVTFAQTSDGQNFPISSPMKLLSLEEAQRQAYTLNRRNQTMPYTTSLPPHRKKVRPWKRKPDKEGKEKEVTSKVSIGCSCIKDTSKLSTTPGSAQWEIDQSGVKNFTPDRLPLALDADMDADMEHKTIPRERAIIPESPVVLRCSRFGEHKLDLSYREARSSLRDKFRRFEVSPVTSKRGVFEEKEGKEHSRSLNTRWLALYGNESLEFIDASSEEELDVRLSPSKKRGKYNNKENLLECDSTMNIKETGNSKVVEERKEGQKEMRNSARQHSNNQENRKSIVNETGNKSDDMNKRVIDSKTVMGEVKTVKLDQKNLDKVNNVCR